jgi:hypothetical protein
MMGLIKGILTAFILFAAFANYREYKISNLYTINTLLIINYLMIIMQLVGFDELFYRHVNYANESIFNPMLTMDEVIIYLPQVRPSGIFPAPTFISFFIIYIFSLYIYFNKNLNKFNQFILGSMMAFVGSTLGLFIFIIFFIIMIIQRKYILVVIGYICSIIIYKININVFFEYNYSYDDILLSILNRNLNESIFTNNFNALIIICCIIISYTCIYIVKINNLDNLIKLGSIILLIFLPIILHDFSNSILGFYFFGTGLGMLSHYYHKRRLLK